MYGYESNRTRPQQDVRAQRSARRNRRDRLDAVCISEQFDERADMYERRRTERVVEQKVS